ncbi:hypothetical protein TcCL_Unassigned06585 [Trypanosoma cruzi]|nr:hypothetical protein TcCL_Unassigned06585 [Trypanosoma cruzi]
MGLAMLARRFHNLPLLSVNAASAAVAVLFTPQRLKKTRAASTAAATTTTTNTGGQTTSASKKTSTNGQHGQNGDHSDPFRFLVPAERPVYALSRGKFTPGRGGKRPETVNGSTMSRPRQRDFSKFSVKRQAEPEPGHYCRNSTTEERSLAQREVSSRENTDNSCQESNKPSPSQLLKLRVVRLS